MICGITYYPGTCDPKDILFHHSKWEKGIFYCGDVQCKGKYPTYTKRLWDEHHVKPDITKEDIVKLVNFEGEDYLFYPSFPINVAFIRGTYADENGNITLEKEVAPLEATSVAQATKNSEGKGIVVVQVERVVKSGTSVSYTHLTLPTMATV